MASSRYTLDALLLSGFRAYLTPKTFDFSVKRCLAVFAPNGSGKSSIIDALEFIFSEDGTLDRLGVRTNENQAGFAALAHNLAEMKSINPKVGIVFKDGIKKHEGSRNASERDRPRPPIADAVSACFTVSPIIRGHALRAFVEEQKAEKRYEDVAGWLQLGPLVDVQRHLRELRRSTKAAVEDQTGLTRVDVQLAKSSANAVKAWDENAVLTYANNTLATLNAALFLKSLDTTDPAFVTAQERAKVEEKQLGLEGLRQIRRTVAVLYEEAKDPDGGTLIVGLLPEFAAAIDVQSSAAAAEAAERTAAANATFAELWKVAEPLFAEGKPNPDICPICATSLADTTAGSVEGVRKHIAEHRAELADYARAKKALDDAASNVTKLHGRLVIALKSLPPLLAKEHAALKSALASHLAAVDAWKNGAPPDAAALQATLHDAAMALDANIKTIELKQGENTYVKVLSKLERLIELKEERELADRILIEIGKLSTALNTQAAYISGEIRKKVQSLLDMLQTPINDIYRGIQGENAAPIRLDLPSEDVTNQQRLSIVVDFAANREGVQPSGFLSDSQIHSLALALRLAAIKKFNAAAPIIALDDIVTSYDADHRRAIAALLANDFADFQLLITTHDERFFSYLKDQVGDKDWHYTRIIRCDPDFGPRFIDHRVTDEMLEKRWHDGESAANEMRQAEEEWLLGICRDFGVNIRIRSVDRAYSYERSELADALAQFLKANSLVPPTVPGVNNRFLASLQQGVVENFGSHFQDGPYGDGSKGDEQARWKEFRYFRDQFICPKCNGHRFKRPLGMSRPVCAKNDCEAQFTFKPAPGPKEDVSGPSTKLKAALLKQQMPGKRPGMTEQKAQSVPQPEKMPDKSSFYITTAISYPNGPPHIGHAYEAIATDAIARFMRLDGYDVYFLTGTDEHGMKIQQTGAKEGLTPHELLERNVPLFQAMVARMECSNDDFIRTTEERHHRSSEEIWRRMEANGDIYLGKYAGWYSVRDEAYYAENETHLNEQKLRVSSKTGTPVDWVEEESYFFRLSAYQQKLLDLFARPNYVLPKERLNEVASFVRGGLQDLSISRTTFDWGIRVPGNPKHIMYVWVDALTNYITGVGFPDTESDKFKRYWPAALHVIGKDIVRFHAVYWPAFLMSAGVEPPRHIFAHGFLFNRGEKMSKSVGNVVDPFALADAYGVDPLRYFFLREVPFGQDGNYSHEAIVNRINADLANDLGNLAQRSLTMIAKQFDGVLPAPGEFTPEDKTILAAADAMIGAARAHMKTQQLHQVLNAVWAVVADANRYFASEAPWALAKTDPKRQGTVLYVTAEVLRCVAIMAQPFVPSSATKLLELLAVRPEERSFYELNGTKRIAPGRTLPAPAPVFPRYVEPEEKA